jgi:hypothetical protein
VKKKFLFLALALLSMVVIFVEFYVKTRTKYEYVNPGRPLSPINLNEDFFERAEHTAANISLSGVLAKAPYPILLRVDGNGKPIEPKLIWINPQTLNSGKVIDGYSFRYSDRIELAVDPISESLDNYISELLEQECSPNTNGETKINFKCLVRGKTGLAHEKGEQKWQSGTVHRYPALVQWVEKGTRDVPYLLYTLYGDTTVDELRQIAEDLKLFD